MKKTILSGLIAAALLAVLFNLPVLAQGVTNFSNLVLSGSLTVGGNATIVDDVAVGGVFEAGTVTSNGDMQVVDDLSTADFILTSQAVITITGGGTITPTGMYQRIASAASTGTSSIANPVAGRMLIVVNVANTTITLTDTGTLKLNGNVALSQYDAVQLLGDGTNWIQIAPVGNN